MDISFISIVYACTCTSFHVFSSIQDCVWCQRSTCHSGRCEGKDYLYCLHVTDDRCYSSIFVKDIPAFSKHLYIYIWHVWVIDILKMMKKKMYEIFYLVHVVDTCIDEILMIGLKAFMLLKSTCVLLFFSFQNLPRLSSWPWPMEVQEWGRCWKSVDPKPSYRYIHLTHRYHTYKPLRCTMEVRNSIERHMLHILQ